MTEAHAIRNNGSPVLINLTFVQQSNSNCISKQPYTDTRRSLRLGHNYPRFLTPLSRHQIYYWALKWRLPPRARSAPPMGKRRNLISSWQLNRSCVDDITWSARICQLALSALSAFLQFRDIACGGVCSRQKLSMTSWSRQIWSVSCLALCCCTQWILLIIISMPLIHFLSI